MKTILFAAFTIFSLIGSACAADPPLTIELTQFKPYTPEYNKALTIVTNHSGQSYHRVFWSCAFYDGDKPVSELSFMTENVQANGKTVETEYFENVQFTSVACRVTRASILSPEDWIHAFKDEIARDCLEGRSEFSCGLQKRWQRESQ